MQTMDTYYNEPNVLLPLRTALRLQADLVTTTDLCTYTFLWVASALASPKEECWKVTIQMGLYILYVLPLGEGHLLPGDCQG